MKQIKILLADDDPIFVFLTKKTIEKTGIDAEIVVFGDGEGAINYLTRNQENGESLPDIIFIDINMPVMDGWEFTEQYSQLRPLLNKDIYMYLLSSTISPHDFDRIRNIQVVTEALIKPLVAAKIKEICGLKNQIET